MSIETATQTADKPTFRFEREPCSRCTGTGQFSYCSMYGTTCFKCAGKGEVLTARGFAAHKWMVERLTVRADEVKVGDRIRIEGVGRFNVKFAGFADDGHRYMDKATGEWAPYFLLKGEKIGQYAFADSKVQRILPADEHTALFAEALAYQASLTQAGKPRRR